MRRVVGGVLLALGTFMLVAAVLLPTYGASGLVKMPLRQFTETVAEASGATVFSPAELKEREGVNLIATRRVKSDVKASSSDTVVYDVFLRVEDPDLVVDDPKERVISATTDRVALDRRTSEAVSCCDENINGEPTKHKGLTYKFPFGTEKKTYQYFDNTAQKSYPIRFVNTEEIEGVEAYKFQMTAEPVQIAELEVPGSLVGSAERSVKAPRFYSNTRTIWVEPKSGVIIKGEEAQLHTLRDENGDDKVTLINATLTWNDETIENQAEFAAERRGTITLLTTVAPIVLGVIGVVLLLVGLFLVLSGRRKATVGRRRAGRRGEPVSV